MNIDVELLRKICNRYCATLEENKSGGFTFDYDNYKEIYSKDMSKESFLKLFKLDCTTKE